MFGFLASSFCSLAYLSMSSTKSRAHTSSLWVGSTQDVSDSSSTIPRLKTSANRGNGIIVTVEEQQSAKTESTASNIFDKSQSKHLINNHGWSTIHVFAGNASHIVDASAIPNDFFENNQWFSQVRQDFIVSNLLSGKRNGYFVDLASNDAIRISNTYALERDFGWMGICIEPNPIYWSSLSYRSNCHVVGAVVGERRMQEVVFKFNTAKGPQSGIVGPNFDNNNGNNNKDNTALNSKEEKHRSTVTLVEVLERFDAPNMIDYLSLDIEGAEYFVMNQFPFDIYRFNILTVERPSPQLEQLLQQNGYLLLKELRKWGETLWIHKDMENAIDKSALDIDIPKYSEKSPRVIHEMHSP
jgi:Methyltransferase FkbM domain